jgi:hypothetical protein
MTQDTTRPLGANETIASYHFLRFWRTFDHETVDTPEGDPCKLSGVLR